MRKLSKTSFTYLGVLGKWCQLMRCRYRGEGDLLPLWLPPEEKHIWLCTGPLDHPMAQEEAVCSSLDFPYAGTQHLLQKELLTLWRLLGIKINVSNVILPKKKSINVICSMSS